MTTCACGRPIVKDQYGAESDADYQSRLAEQRCRSKCRRLFPKERIPYKPVLTDADPEMWNVGRVELRAVGAKELPIRDQARLAFCRSLPCCICGSVEGVHAHHENEPGSSTMGGKTDDTRTAPMCWQCHKARHDKGREVFGKVDVEAVIRQVNESFKAKKIE